MGKKLKDVGLTILRQKYLWTILAFVIVVGFLDPNSYWHRYQLHLQNQELRKEIAFYEEKYAADSKELEALEHSPEAVERVARVNLSMKTADEDVYEIQR